MRLLSNGAQRASLRSRFAAVLGASLLASVFVFGAGAAAPAGAAASTPPLADVEAYYLKLLNCTRTGGWVLKDGTCKGYGTGTYSKYVAPLKRSDTLSAVSRHWAKRLAITGYCKHGDVYGRLAGGGFTGYTWGENIGCYDVADAYTSVLSSHRAMQAEKSTGGGHWKNMKNPAYKKVGIGVWQASGHTRLVTDFIGG